MQLKNLENKKICILGYGIENQALVNFLIKKKIKCEITICDAQKNIKKTHCSISLRNNKNINWQLGKNYDKNLKNFNIIFRIAGYPLIRLHKKISRSIQLTISSPTKLFFELCQTKNIIGVTGTNGKGTTASLIYKILKSHIKTKHCHANVYFGGNIGISMFSFIEKIKKNDWVILELSSFQLEDINKSPQIAVFTNFTEDHLMPSNHTNPNFHKSMNDYWQAKSNIFIHQDKNCWLIINEKLKSKLNNKNLKSKIKYFSKSNLPSALLGEHNKENIATAIEVAKLVGIKYDAIKKIISKFEGLEHRIEFVKKINGKKYYNDSFAVSPDATITALKSFDSRITLILGGTDKGAKFNKLAKTIKKYTQFVVILKGNAISKLKKELYKIKYPKNKIKLAKNMENAVNTANNNSSKGDVILLSPACASFGMFKNYKERGELFKQEIKKIPNS